MWIKINPDRPIVKGKVSVVIPVHWLKREWLIRAFSSVLNQEYHNVELIVVNDESTENIDDIIESFDIKKYIKNKGNMKLPYSMNRGFELADGEYLSYIGGDDYMLPNMLSRLVTELEKDEKFSIAIGRHKIIDENDNVINHRADIQLANIAGANIKSTEIERKVTFFGTFDNCFIYRREVLAELGGYDETAIGTEDYDFWIRASRQFKIRRIPVEEPPLVAYRVHSNTISSIGPGLAKYCTLYRIPILRREAQLYPEDGEIAKAIKYHTHLIREAQKQKLLKFVKQAIRKPLSFVSIRSKR